MQRSLALLVGAGAAAALVVGCGEDAPGPLFEPRPECAGAAIEPFAGQHTQLISALEIGSIDDGFDLDGDGEPDNKLAAVGSFAGSAITEALNDFSLMIPIEMFDFPTAGADACVKFALYLGLYTTDGDDDGGKTAVAAGDCDDHDPLAARGRAEVAGNRKDDDCDGLADEQNDGPDQTPSADNTGDMDGDTVTLMGGDCDDTNAMVRGGSFAEICGDGRDNDCDGVADRKEDASGASVQCNPYDGTPDQVRIDPASFDPDGTPSIEFDSGSVSTVDGVQRLSAGPAPFQVAVPITSDIILTLKITGTTIEGDIVMEGDRVVVRNGRLGGVIDGRTADTIRGLTVDVIGLLPAQSLLDAIFANALGPLLVLPVRPTGDKYEGCRMPDIDVDRDGREVFCDTDGNPATQEVDLCVDGDGTEVRDEIVNGVVKHCSEALDASGKPRFVDGVSVELNFETAGADFIRPAP